MMRKKLLATVIIISILASLAIAGIPVHAQDTVTIDAKIMYADGYVPGVDPTGIVMVNVAIISPSGWRNTKDGIVQWALNVEVDPAVLEPYGVLAGQGGYFLDDYITSFTGLNDPFHFTYKSYGMPPVIDKEAGTMEMISYGITPDPPTGAGGSQLLCTLAFISKSKTAYSPIDIYYDETMDAKYYCPGDIRKPVDVVVDGHYNAPPVPEFPLGSVAPIALIAAIAYIWWVTRRKRQEAV